MSLIVSNLTCEYRINPLGIDALQPRLSWQLESDQRGTRQTAYRILVAASESALCGGSLLWDSGKVESDQSIHITYSGPGLVSGQRVYWKVGVLLRGGKWVYWNLPIGWDNGSARLFRVDQGRPVQLPISGGSSELQNRLLLHACM